MVTAASVNRRRQARRGDKLLGAIIGAIAALPPLLVSTMVYLDQQAGDGMTAREARKIAEAVVRIERIEKRRERREREREERNTAN